MTNPPDSLLAEIESTPVIILAGGFGTRLAEETTLLPKPMVEIKGLPIIVHIMDYYARFGFKNFLICGGYKIEVLKQYFMGLPLVGKDVDVRFAEGAKAIVTTPSRYLPSHDRSARTNWRVTILETGLNAMTGARVRKAMHHASQMGHKRVCITYGDGLTDADFFEEYKFHKKHGKIGTVLAVHPPTRFGILEINAKEEVTSFSEKPHRKDEFINGGFFILDTEFLKYLPQDDDQCILERQPLESLARDRQLRVFKHDGFWQCMDSMRDKQLLEGLVDRREAPWMTKIQSPTLSSHL